MTDRETQPSERRFLFTLLGVPWTAGSGAVQFIPSRIGTGIVFSLLVLQHEALEIRLLYGVIFGLLLTLTQALHSIGHTLGSRYVGTPIDENMVIAYQISTLYHNDPGDLPSRVYISRALSGPMMNISIGIVILVVWRLTGGYIWSFLALSNLGLGIGVLIVPVSSLDGGVILREMRRMRDKRI